MTDDCFRFPQTAHIDWLGEGTPREDKLLVAEEVAALLGGPVVVEEKLDGANLGFSLAPDGTLRAQNRGQYLAEPHAGQLKRLPDWLQVHGQTLETGLDEHLVVFGEWCAARHSLGYSALPDWWLLFDVYDRQAQRFWSSARRDALARELGVTTVPRVDNGRHDDASLKQLMQAATSHYREGALEGLVVRREDDDWLQARSKLVRADFNQHIESHWRSRPLEWNRVDWVQERRAP